MSKAKELFDLFAGQMIPVNRKIAKETGRLQWTDDFYTLSGYNDRSNLVIMEHPGGSNQFDFTEDDILMSIPPTWRGLREYVQTFDWDKMAAKFENTCFSCGRPYKNKKEHRKVCGK